MGESLYETMGEREWCKGSDKRPRYEKNQFGFMLGISTMNAIFSLRQYMDKY